MKWDTQNTGDSRVSLIHVMEIRPYRVYNSLPKKLGFIFGACADSTDSGNRIFWYSPLLGMLITLSHPAVFKGHLYYVAGFTSTLPSISVPRSKRE